MKTAEELAEIIESHVENGFWKSSNKQLFGEKCVELIAHNYTEQEAIDLLLTLFGAVSSEFGS